MRHQKNSGEVQPLDPIAMTLALWLGLIVAVTGLIRLSENAAAQAATHPRTMSVDEMQTFNPRMMAFGG